MHSAAGWPDLTLCRGARLLFLELKTQKGKLSFAQREWLDDLETVAMSNPGVEAHCFRPSDMPTIRELLV